MHGVPNSFNILMNTYYKYKYMIAGTGFIFALGVLYGNYYMSYVKRLETLKNELRLIEQARVSHGLPPEDDDY